MGLKPDKRARQARHLPTRLKYLHRFAPGDGHAWRDAIDPSCHAARVPIATQLSRLLPGRLTLDERRSRGYREQAERDEPEYNGVRELPDIAQLGPVTRAPARDDREEEGARR